jgi:hypothetical protein
MGNGCGKLWVNFGYLWDMGYNGCIFSTVGYGEMWVFPTPMWDPFPLSMASPGKKTLEE